MTKNETVETALTKVKDWLTTPSTIVDLTVRAFRTRGKVPRAGWSQFNQFLTFAASTEDGRSVKQWKDVGRTVNEEAEPFYIFQPIVISRWEVDSSGRRQRKSIFTGRFRLLKKYRVEDTTGKELTRDDIPPRELPPLMDVAEMVCDAPVRWRAACDNVLGYYKRATNQITMLSDHTGVFFHELGHAVHRSVDRRYESRTKGYLEMVAELSAMALCVLYSPEDITPSWSSDYIQTYAGGDLMEKLPQVFSMVGKVVGKVYSLEESRAS